MFNVGLLKWVNLCLLSILLYTWLCSKDFTSQEKSPDLKFRNIHLETDLQDVEIMAKEGYMQLGGAWEMVMTHLNPITRDGFSIKPNSLSFKPKSGEVIFHDLNFQDKIEINQIVMGPSILNINFVNIEATYRYMGNNAIKWNGWRINRLESRDALALWPKIMDVLNETGHDIREETKKVNSVGQLNEKKAIKYLIKAKSLSVHQSLIHFRISLKNIEIETQQGLVKAPTARLKVGDEVLVLSHATLERKGELRNFERLLFNYKTGKLEGK